MAIWCHADMENAMENAMKTTENAMKTLTNAMKTLTENADLPSGNLTELRKIAHV